jgi:hypothetical protein
MPTLNLPKSARAGDTRCIEHPEAASKKILYVLGLGSGKTVYDAVDWIAMSAVPLATSGCAPDSGDTHAVEFSEATSPSLQQQ